MDIVKLTLTKVPGLFLEAENITPDHFAGKNAQQIGELHVHLGNQTAKISDYFSVEGKGGATAADTRIIVSGPTDKVKYIGMKMTARGILICIPLPGWLVEKSMSKAMLTLFVLSV